MLDFSYGVDRIIEDEAALESIATLNYGSKKKDQGKQRKL